MLDMPCATTQCLLHRLWWMVLRCIARYPNVGNFNDVKAFNSNVQLSTRNVGDFNNEGTSDEKRKFKTVSGRPFRWEQTGDIWIDGSMSKAWEWKKNRIEHLVCQTRQSRWSGVS